MCYRYHKVNVANAFASYFFLSNLHTATVAHNAFVADTFVLTAMAFVIFYWSENPFAEQTTHFRLKATVVDGFRFGNLAMRLGKYRLRRRQAYTNLRKITFDFYIFF
jgi:hypothetical protein